jgi:epoxyqueuosine reductase
VVDGSKCISYFTIELKDAIPQEMKGQFDNWMFGCDICQEVCPWNRFSIQHQELEFNPNAELFNMTKADREQHTKETFSRVFKKSHVKRTKYAGLVRNIEFIV